MPRRLISALLAVSVVLLTACAQIPRESDVQAGPELDPRSANEPIYYSPSGPFAGQSPEQVISGFLTAGTGPQNDYSTAREYLTKDFKAQWTPNDEVLVQEGGLDIELRPDNSVLVTIKVQTRVDAEGKLYTFNSPPTRVLTYDLVQENQQWRISKAPNLTILNKPVFDVLFSDYSLYFFDSTKQYLVPELRWFPARASTATRLVNGLLEGPSDWLQPALEDPLPDDVKLAIQAVTIQNGEAAVNLSSSANSLSNEQLRFFKTQTQATLRQLPTVTDVSIFLDGLPKSLANVNYSQTTGSGTTPVVLSSEALGFVGGSAVQGAQILLRESTVKDFALSVDTRELVMLTQNGLQWAKLGQIDKALTTLDTRNVLLSPIFDRSGRVWSFGKLFGADVRIVTRTDSTSVSADWLGPYEKLSYSISDEGSRIAVILSNRFETKLVIAAVIRDKNGVPKALGEPIEFKPKADRPVAVAWFGENSLAVAYQSASTDLITVYRAGLGGTVEAFGTVPKLNSLFASSLGNAVYAVTTEGDLYENQGFGFSLIASGVTAAHMPY